MQPLADFLHESQLLRRAATLIRSDRKQLSLWHGQTVATARIARWVSSDQRRRATAARERSDQLRSVSARLRCQAAELMQPVMPRS